MPDPTTNFSWDPPDVGGDVGNWGTVLNTLIDDIDDDLNTVKTTADAALPVAGGTMTGVLVLKAEDAAISNLGGAISGNVAMNADAANFFYATTGGNVSRITISNSTSGKVFAFMLELTMGGSHTVTFDGGGATWLWPGGTAPTLTSGETYLIVGYTRDGGTTINAALSMDNLA